MNAHSHTGLHQMFFSRFVEAHPFFARFNQHKIRITQW
jgi:hypothetical protein